MLWSGTTRSCRTTCARPSCAPSPSAYSCWRPCGAESAARLAELDLRREIHQNASLPQPIQEQLLSLLDRRRTAQSTAGQRLSRAWRGVVLLHRGMYPVWTHAAAISCAALQREHTLPPLSPSVC